LRPARRWRPWPRRSAGGATGIFDSSVASLTHTAFAVFAVWHFQAGSYRLPA
jgi:hypothetical protein